MSFEESNLSFDEYFSYADLHVPACPPPPQLNWLTPTENEFKIYQKSKRYYEEKKKQYDLEYSIAEKEKEARKQEFEKYFTDSLNLPMAKKYPSVIIKIILEYCLANTNTPVEAINLGIDIINFIKGLAGK